MIVVQVAHLWRLTGFELDLRDHAHAVADEIHVLGGTSAWRRSTFVDALNVDRGSVGGLLAHATLACIVAKADEVELVVPVRTLAPRRFERVQWRVRIPARPGRAGFRDSIAVGVIFIGGALGG